MAKRKSPEEIAEEFARPNGDLIGVIALVRASKDGVHLTYRCNLCPRKTRGRMNRHSHGNVGGGWRVSHCPAQHGAEIFLVSSPDELDRALAYVYRNMTPEQARRNLDWIVDMGYAERFLRALEVFERLEGLEGQELVAAIRALGKAAA